MAAARSGGGYGLAGRPEREQEAVRFMRQRKDEGASYREIAGELDAAGYSPPLGTRWFPGTVRRLVVRKDDAP
jgi:hypothetical protein